MDLPYELPEDFVGTAAETIAGVYHLNCDRHDLDAGDDTLTFGIHSYRNTHNALEAHFRGADGVVPFRENGVVVLEVQTTRGPVWVRIYKSGRTAADDPHAWRCDDRDAALRHARNNGPSRQLSLFEGDSEVPRALVLLHAGNEVDGLCAVYLGAPAVQNGHHVGWHFLICVWRKDSTTAARIEASDTVAFDLQDEPELDVRFKPQADETDSTGEQEEQ